MKKSIFAIVAALVIGPLFVSAQTNVRAPEREPEEMKVDGFLKIPPIEGEALEETDGRSQSERGTGTGQNDDGVNRAEGVDYSPSRPNNSQDITTEPEETGTTSRGEYYQHQRFDYGASSITLRQTFGSEMEREEFETFVRRVVDEDDNIRRVETSDESVRVDYRVPARFLGIFNTGITARAEASTEGETRIRLPWYGFLFRADTSSGNAKMSDTVSSIIQNIK